MSIQPLLFSAEDMMTAVLDSQPQDAYRFLSKLSVGHESGCWHWVASCRTSGGRSLYGQFYFRGGVWKAHRVSWTLLKGEIPPGLQIDHLCRNTICVNPDHPEPVTPQVNCLRSNSVAAKHALKTHCPQGHLYDMFRVRTKGAYRGCHACENAQARARRAAKRAVAT